MAESTYQSAIALQTCISCGIVFGMDRGLDLQRREDHKAFFCPNGHQQYYSGKMPAEKERDEARARAERFETQLADMRQAMPIDHRAAVRRAERWSDNRALLGAFWAGFNARECGRCSSTCPYETERGGFRRAWLSGFGEDTNA